MTDLGLALNMIGTLLIAISFGALSNKQGGTTEIDNSKKVYEFAYVKHPVCFNIGIVVLLIGFALQLDIIQYWFAKYFT